MEWEEMRSVAQSKVEGVWIRLVKPGQREYGLSKGEVVFQLLSSEVGKVKKSKGGGMD